MDGLDLNWAVLIAANYLEEMLVVRQILIGEVELDLNESEMRELSPSASKTYLLPNLNWVGRLWKVVVRTLHVGLEALASVEAVKRLLVSERWVHF